MEHAYIVSALWLFLAVFSAIIAYHINTPIALVEICMGAIAGTIANKYFGYGSLRSNLEWLKFLASTGAIFLTFLAGTELDAKVIKFKLKEVLTVGTIGFLAPFIGCSLVAYYILKWDLRASLLAGVALSTTSMAVVYTVMLETGLNMTEYGKGILGACFINDVGTVVALGLIFATFTYKTLVFVVTVAVVTAIFPSLTTFFTKVYGNRTAAIRVKWVSFVLFSMAALAVWSGVEAVLPAYIAGMALAEFASQNHIWVRRLRSLTVGFLTPFYFIRAGSFVSNSCVDISTDNFYCTFYG
jgi:glutathione-regulated potassium-efflux system ancillary protein KefC